MESTIISYNLTASITFNLLILQVFIIIPYIKLDSKIISSSYTYTMCFNTTMMVTKNILSPKCLIVNDFNYLFRQTDRQTDNFI